MRIVLFLVVWYCGKLWAQSLVITPNTQSMLERSEVMLNAHQWHHYQSNSPISSVAFEMPTADASIMAVCESDTFWFRPDPHLPSVSTLWVLAHPSPAIRIVSHNFTGKLKMVILHVPTISAVLPRISALRVAYCEGQKPVVVPVTTWRLGLPAPKERPSITQVRHLVVHHSAGSNTASNYTDVVRNIYVFHTQSNGWNDVGYNFLIAQDGTIFEGRDGQGQAEGDNVLGAHFCGKNTATMGVCLLGDYQTAQPTEVSVRSLLQLLSWKIKKDNLDVLIPAPHPPAAPQGNLATLVGHRDGCATDCPGNNVYARLNEFRTSLAACGYTKPLAVGNIPSSSFTLSQWEHEYEFKSTYPIESLYMTDLIGRRLFCPTIEKSDTSIGFNVSHLSSGLYLMRGSNRQGQSITYKIIVP